MKVVLVEDSPLVRKHLLAALKEQPFLSVVGIAATEAEALCTVGLTRPHVVVLDLSLASGSGLEVLRKLRIAGFGGTILVHFVGRKLVGLTFMQQKLEADFRYSMIRARENVEGIALYCGEADEKRVFTNRFGEAIREDMIKGEFLQEDINWIDFRMWKLGRDSFQSSEIAISAQYQVIIGAAYFQKNLLPAQRRLLREVATDINELSEKPADGPQSVAAATSDSGIARNEIKAEREAHREREAFILADAVHEHARAHRAVHHAVVAGQRRRHHRRVRVGLRRARRRGHHVDG